MLRCCQQRTHHLPTVPRTEIYSAISRPIFEISSFSLNPLNPSLPIEAEALHTMPPPTRQQNPSSRNYSTTTTTATLTQTLTSTPVLRLRATAPPPQNRRRIQWAEDVVDNEGLGRKRSKGKSHQNDACINDGELVLMSSVVGWSVCCIYHAPHPVGESSSESSSDSSSDSESDGDDSRGDDGRARLGGKGKAKKQRHQHGEPSEGCGHDHSDGGRGERRVKRKGANAYETAPKVKTAELKSWGVRERRGQCTLCTV